jgi:hypothetical protein
MYSYNYLQMRTTAIPNYPEDIILTVAENYRKITEYLKSASEFDDISVIYLKKGNYEKAAECAILAQEYIRLASDIKIEDIKLHAAYN